MGIVRMGPPAELIDALLERHEIPVFVETGTYMGETARWAAGRFEQVITVELAEGLYLGARDRLADCANVEVRHADSRSALADVVATLDRPALFWLDAHWSGGPTSGEDDQCPITDEIAILARARPDRYVLIDDARLFTSPPPPPHRPEQWPSLRAVLDALHDERLSEAVLIEDVIAAVPPAAWPVLVDYAHRAADRQWQEHLQRTQPSLRGGAQLVRRGAGLALADVRRRVRR